jgi:hypothetical protein
MQPEARTSNQLRTAVRINARLDKNLTAYATVAGAAGLGILALAQPAEAKIVYTPTNATISNVPILVDFNNDGITDLSFVDVPYAYDTQIVAYAGNNRIMSRGKPLPWGARISPKASFSESEAILVRVDHHFSCAGTTGYWKNERNNYLGIQFTIAGQTHYGWVRLTVSRFCHSNDENPAFLMTGYAYETIPNKPITAGETYEPRVADADALKKDLVPVRQLPRLGLLALGADGLNIWRREEEVA